MTNIRLAATRCRPVGESVSSHFHSGQAGFTLLEILITLFVLLVGLLGLVALQAKSQQSEMESYQRTQALVLLQDFVDRMNANRKDAHNLVYVTTSAVGGGGALTDCTGLTGAPLDLCEWGNLLRGAAEVSASGNCTSASGADCVGAMIGARGCVAYDNTTELKDGSGAVLPGTGIYTISVAWQGFQPTAAPPAALTCGQNAYGDEARRRIVSSTLRIGALGAL